MKLQISINGEPINIGEPVPNKVNYFNVTCPQQHPMFRQSLAPGQSPLIKQWLNKVIANLNLEDGYATYNGTLIQQADISSFKL